MNKIIINEYDLYNPRINNKADILCISDIHSEIELLKRIKEYLKSTNIDFILVPGDLVDSLNDERNEEMHHVLDKIAHIVPIYVVLGNHDLFYSINKKKSYEFYNEIKRSNNITIFNEFTSKKQLTEDIALHGLNLPLSWYLEKEKESTFNRLLNSIQEVDDKEFNIMITHSPSGLIKNKRLNDRINYLKNMNLVLCGHMHAGLVPIPLRKNHHLGLVGPYRSLFPKNAHGIIQDTVLISGGLTKISKSSEAKMFAGFFNKTLSHELELIHMNKGKNHALKLTNRIKMNNP